MSTSPGRAPVLERPARRAPKPPIRIVHLGLGAFHRAHQAFYTDRVDTETEWGIAAFTGRRPDLAQALAAQGGLYTLIERSDSGDSFTLVASIVDALDGNDLARLAELVAAPATAIITLTVTEAAYRVRAGSLVPDADLEGDLDRLSTAWRTSSIPAALTSVPGRLVFALAARRRAGSGPLAVVPCDNLLDNAQVVRAAVTNFASLAEARTTADTDTDTDTDTDMGTGLVDWIGRNVSYVSTCVDRITPATTPLDVATVARECGYRDDVPVVTESFHEWVLSGEFPAGRPAWEKAGARFVDDIRPYETRKLYLLNGAHSLLAYQGQLRGLRTVDEAITDGQCRAAVEAFWDVAQKQLTDEALHLEQYRRQLLQRFADRSIRHQLAQIAIDGSTKLRQRVVPVVLATRPTDRAPVLAILAAWIDYLAALPQVSTQLDAAATEINAALALDGPSQTRALLTLLEPSWTANDPLVAAVHAARRCDWLAPSVESVPVVETVASVPSGTSRSLL